jgi:2-dehydropantoate 2-reductase
MQIKSVAVLGAGAVGSYVIWGLSSRKDIRLAVIAEGPRAERLKQQGITINGTTRRFGPRRKQTAWIYWWLR